MTTTTHDPLGGGQPRLVFVRGDTAQTDDDQREFHLLPGVTVLGSGPDADLVLAGLPERYAEIRRDKADEYVYVHLGGAPATLVDGRPVEASVLRTGSRLEMGPWVLSYLRAEYADHGRPHGGRQGGEGSRQHPQEIPRARGTSVDGGSAQTSADAGEYF